MDLVIGLFKMSKMDQDMDKVVACVHEIRRWGRVAGVGWVVWGMLGMVRLDRVG